MSRPEWHGEARRLSAQGLSQRQIAARLNKSPAGVAYALNDEARERELRERREANAPRRRTAA